MFWKKIKNNPNHLWHELSSMEELNKIDQDSVAKPQLIFKHSTRCSISDMALNRINKEIEALDPLCDLHYLDLIAFRNISNEIEERYAVIHESPQIILVNNKSAVYNASHSEIAPEELIRHLG